MCKTTHMKVTGEKLNACFLEYPRSIENKLTKIISVSVSKSNVCHFNKSHHSTCNRIGLRFRKSLDPKFSHVFL